MSTSPLRICLRSTSRRAAPWTSDSLTPSRRTVGAAQTMRATTRGDYSLRAPPEARGGGVVDRAALEARIASDSIRRVGGHRPSGQISLPVDVGWLSVALGTSRFVPLSQTVFPMSVGDATPTVTPTSFPVIVLLRGSVHARDEDAGRVPGDGVAEHDGSFPRR